MKVREQQTLKESGISTLKKAIVIRSLIALHFILMIGLFLCCWIIFYRLPAKQGEYFVHNRSIAASYILLFAVFSRIYAGYKVGIYRIGELIHGQFFSNLMSWGITYFLACVMAQQFLNPLMALGCLIVQNVFGGLLTTYMNRVYFRFYKSKRTVVFFRNQNDLNKIRDLAAIKNKWQIVRCLRCLHQGDEIDLAVEPKPIPKTACSEETIDDDIHQIMNIIDEYEAVFIAGVDATLRNGIVKHCVETQKECYFVPHTGDVLTAGATHMKVFPVPIFRVGQSNSNPEFLFAKRVFDIVLSGLGLLALWPIMLITALLIKLYDHGPVFYKQIRLTKNGKTFEIIKFRSMKVSAESDGVARLASANDDRITPVGKVIRAIRFDELPQLINILKGDMSIVGPRPERPEIAAKYLEELPAFNLRLQVKAGLTGYAQVYGRYYTEPADKLKMDLMYINNMSMIEDLRLLVATVQILFMKESAQGEKGNSLQNEIKKKSA